jgi:hypothetical protein
MLFFFFLIIEACSTLSDEKIDDIHIRKCEEIIQRIANHPDSLPYFEIDSSISRVYYSLNYFTSECKDTNVSKFFENKFSCKLLFYLRDNINTIIKFHKINKNDNLFIVRSKIIKAHFILCDYTFEFLVFKCRYLISNKFINYVFIKDRNNWYLMSVENHS